MGEGLTLGREWRQENRAVGVEAGTRALAGMVAQGNAQIREPRSTGLANGLFPVLC